MHDILIALVFVGMVACPAVVSMLPTRDAESEATGFESLSLALAHAKAAVPGAKTAVR